MTVLNILKQQIAVHGPVDVGTFMALALGHPQHGYYMTRDPFGAKGDFTTAPEISQMFGEMIGAWVADIWMQMGSPAAFTLLECGPGRGTLMADMMRATRHVPGFHAACGIHFLEMSPVLKQAQARAMTGFTPQWHESLANVPSDRPMIVIANEFLDALPIRQYHKTDDGWFERMIDVQEDALVFVSGAPVPPGWMPVAPVGSIVEVSPARQSFVSDLAGRIAQTGGAALLIDYGHARSAPGDTLQALYKHTSVPVLEHVGEADVTAHVDFDPLAKVAADAGLAVHGPVGQGDFLKASGIEQRATILKRNASAEQAEAIEKALHRLTDSREMGVLFKVMGIVHGQNIRPAGF
jgi:NADH dehydrogenase [ubiquinone] 1 alpha subcomplex assembly factor 7